MRKALYILGGLEEADIRWMASAGARRSVRSGETLIRAGEAVDAFYIVIDGAFDVTLGTGAAIARLTAGEVLGEMSLVEKRPPTVSVTAIQPGTVLRLPQAALQAKLGGDHGFAARFYRALAVFLSDRLRGTVAQLGYGAPDTLESFEAENELDEGLLDSLHVAGDRMRRLTALLEGADPTPAPPSRGA